MTTNFHAVVLIKSPKFLIKVFSNQVLSENKLSIYNFYALKNLQFGFQEKNLNLNRDTNLGSPDQ